ncbi:MAG: hypothetical protein M3680_11775 [Myxococcota bacterium]|nr:hypothetical protein [Myxococcota bacterium]
MGPLRNALILAVLLMGRPAAAEVDIGKADKLFAEGLALRESNLEQSCQKFEESLTYNPQAIGTLMNVALCDEKLGRIASAVAKFSEARDRAKEQQLADHQKASEEHLALLLPELPYLTIKFTTPPIAETRVLIDDRFIPMNKISRLPVDPGERVIVVSAPGRLPYQTKILIAKRELKDIDVPELAESVTVKSSRRTIGKITTASGLAAVVTSVAIGLYARGVYKDQFGPGKCMEIEGAAAQCPPENQTETERAITLGTVGTVVGIVGVAAVGAGLYLWLRSPKESAVQPTLSVVPQLSPESAGVAAIGRF